MKWNKSIEINPGIFEWSFSDFNKIWTQSDRRNLVKIIFESAKCDQKTTGQGILNSFFFLCCKNAENVSCSCHFEANCCQEVFHRFAEC